MILISKTCDAQTASNARSFGPGPETCNESLPLLNHPVEFRFGIGFGLIFGRLSKEAPAEEEELIWLKLSTIVRVNKHEKELGLVFAHHQSFFHDLFISLRNVRHQL